MQENIAKLVQKVPTFTEADVGKTIHRYFEQDIYVEGIVVLNNEKPVGLIMRNDFYQKIGKQYGQALFMNRSIGMIMDTNPLIVDSSAEVVDVSIMAMDRKQEFMYDFVIVTEDDKYLGIVSVRLFLVELSQKREKEIELLKKQKESLKRANELEKLHGLQMEEKNAELNAKNSSIRNLLDNAGQGFLTFNKDMIIADEYSVECTKIFGREIGGNNFLNLISRYVEKEKIATIESIFDSIFNREGGASSKVYLSLLPKELVIKEKIVRLEYKIIDEDAQKKVMLVLTDITDKKALETKMEEERNNLKLIVKVISNQSDLIAAMKDFECFFEKQGYEIVHSGYTKKEIISEIFRAVHTFKGDFGNLGMYNTSNNLHVLENTIAKMSEDIESIGLNDLQYFIRDINYHSMMEKDLYIIADILGEDYLNIKESFAVSGEKIIEIEEKIKSKLTDEQALELLPMVQHLRYINIKDILLQYNDMVKNLAKRLEKEISDINVNGEDVYIDKHKYSKVLKSLVHIFRNSIDHGIESPEERVTKGKPEFGSIECKLESLGDYFRIYIRDDGNGIHSENIVKKAIEKGILPAGEADEISCDNVIDLLFMDEFSTRESVTTLSGRGVGLPAVKAEVRSLDGEIHINSQPNQYTEFIITLPVL